MGGNAFLEAALTACLRQSNTGLRESNKALREPSSPLTKSGQTRKDRFTMR
jgi:hypothetical protein